MDAIFQGLTSKWDDLTDIHWFYGDAVSGDGGSDVISEQKPLHVAQHSAELRRREILYSGVVVSLNDGYIQRD